MKLALEESELRYRRLFETAQDGILILDADSGTIIDVNPFLLDLLDYPFESIIGLQLWEIGLFEDITANQAAFKKLQTEEYIRYENHPLRTKAGKQIQVEFVSNVYFIGSAKVIQCNIRDISVRAEFQAVGVEIQVGDRPYYNHGPRYYERGSAMVWVPGHMSRNGHTWIHGHYGRMEHRQ